MANLSNHGVIYKLSFGESTRVYIGQTVNIKNRLKYHKSHLRFNKHGSQKLQDECNLYGLESLKIEVLETVPIHNLRKKEREYIELYDSFNSGLNSTGGLDTLLTINSKTIYFYDSTTGEMLGSDRGYVNLATKLGLNESNIRQICYGTMKKAKGYHFSLNPKTKEQVLSDVKLVYGTAEYTAKMSALFSGEGNPMFGKNRIDMRGENNPMRKFRAKGLSHAPKVKMPKEKIAELYQSGMTQKEVAKIAQCTQVHISSTLISMGICKFKRKKAS
jgi:hypothetical protein